MFNLFKKKIELKNCSALMESVPCNDGIKVNTEINVPINYKCMLYYHSKCYLILDAGKYNINSALAQKLFEKQEKYVKQNKRVKVIFHYICLGEKDICVNIMKKSYIFKIMLTNIERFADFILLYNYKTDEEYTNACIKDLLEFSIKTSPSTKDIASYNTKFEPFGFKIVNINLKSNSSFNYMFDNKDTSSNGEQRLQNQLNTQVIINRQLNTPNIKDNQQDCNRCPKCNKEIKFRTTYCINCGYKLDL